MQSVWNLIEAATKEGRSRPFFGDAWMDPSGKLYAIGDDMHEDWAARHFMEEPDDGDLTMYSCLLHEKGWLRVIFTDSIIVNGLKGQRPNRSQKAALEDCGMDNDLKVVFVSKLGTHQREDVIYAPPNTDD